MKHRIFLLFTLLSLALASWAQRFAVLADIHVTPGNANEQALRQAVDEINAGKFDAVIVDGDLSNEGSDEQLRNVKTILDGIRHPLYVLPGNHENNWSQSATKTFVDLWGKDRFVSSVDSLIIIGINCGPFMKMGDGHIKQEDLHWLDATLAEKCKPGMRVLSFNHYPLLEDLDNCSDYMAILEKYPVIGHVNGHYHTSKTYASGTKDAHGTLPGIMVRALDMKNNNYGYTVLDITPDWIHVYNKEIGKAAQPRLAVPAVTKHRKAVFPARAAIVAPEGMNVIKLWADSASVFTRLAFDGKNVYFGNSLGQVRAIDKRNGQARWSAATGASLFGRPTVLGKNRVAMPMHNGINVYKTSNGKKTAHYSTPEGPVVADGALTPDGKGYIQGAYKRIERRRASDGSLQWAYDSIFNYCQAAPAMDGTDLVFGAWDTNLRCLDLNTGRLRWVWNNGKSANMLGPGNVVPVISGDKVFVVAPDRYMTALDRKTGHQLWRDNSHKYRESLGHSAEGKRVYAKTMDGELVAVDATADGFKELWTVDMGLGYDHAPCIVAENNGIVWAGSRRGILTAVKADGSGVLASLPLGVSEINGIDIDPATGDVYVSLIEGTIYRISTNGR